MKHDHEFESLARERWRVASGLTLGMVVTYFGFILLVAFRKDLLGTLLVRGLTLGIALGVLVIVTAWTLTYAYVAWANDRFDPRVARLRSELYPENSPVAPSLAALAKGEA